MSAEQRVAELGIQLPELPKPIAAYVLWVQSGSLLYTSGMGPLSGGRFAYQGKVGAELSVDEGRDAARLCMLNLLSIVREALGTLDKVERVIKLLGFVASAPGFGQQPEVLNGASELLEAIWGEGGWHARSAIGVNELPRNIPVEIEMIVEVRAKTERS